MKLHLYKASRKRCGQTIVTALLALGALTSCGKSEPHADQSDFLAPAIQDFELAPAELVTNEVMVWQHHITPAGQIAFSQIMASAPSRITSQESAATVFHEAGQYVVLYAKAQKLVIGLNSDGSPSIALEQFGNPLPYQPKANYDSASGGVSQIRYLPHGGNLRFQLTMTDGNTVFFNLNRAKYNAPAGSISYYGSARYLTPQGEEFNGSARFETIVTPSPTPSPSSAASSSPG